MSATEPMQLVSTSAGIYGSRDLEAMISRGEVPTFGYAKSVILGQAPDGGLLMPSKIPRMNWSELEAMKGAKYEELYALVMSQFSGGVLTLDENREIGHDAYGREGSSFEPFIERLENKRVLVRLDEGLTADFKYFAAATYFRTTNTFRAKFPDLEIKPGLKLRDIEMIMYLTSTTGDTGGAMGTAARDMPGMGMLIFYPSKIGRDVSHMQAQIMENIGGKNIFVRRVDGNFTEISDIVSQLQGDPELSFMHLNTANSVNIGRLPPQTVYYIWAYLKLVDRIGEELVYSVPSGNFGNLTAGLIAKRLTGLPMKFVVGLNENNMFETFFNTGRYEPLPDLKYCISNAMNVRVPSNLRRLVQFYGGQITDGELRVPPDFDRMKEDIVYVTSVSDAETKKVLRQFYDEHHVIHDKVLGEINSSLDPHGAISYEADTRFRAATGYDGKSVDLITAHSGKYLELLSELGIHDIILPPNLRKAKDSPMPSSRVLECTPAALKGETLQVYGAMMQMSRGTFRW